MHRYRSHARCLLVGAAALAVTACAVPSSRDNFEAAARLVRSQSRASLEWYGDPAAEQAARARAAALLDGDLTIDAAVSVAFLVNPGLQVALEQLAISRAQLVAAVTPLNPVAIIGSRRPGGDFAAFYPDRTVSVGVLQNVISLLSIPDSAAVARHELERARYATADLAVSHAALVVEAWLEHSAALQIHQLRLRDLEAAQNPQDRVRAAGEAISSELAVATTRGRLGERMGVTGWRDDWHVSGPLPSAPDADPDPLTLETAALQQRLDLQAATRTVDARLRVLAMQRRFRWLNQMEIGASRDIAVGGTAFTGPNLVVEVPVFDQRRAALLKSDAELRQATRQLEVARITARSEIRLHAAELHAIRQKLQLYGSSAELVGDPDYIGVLLDYWRTRSALALSAGDWSAISGL